MKYKLNNSINKLSKFSFDFDGTLDDDFDGTINNQKEEIRNICKYLINEGKDICIITKRYKTTESDKVYKLANELGVNKVYFTNREYKDSKILEFGIELHFENNEYEAELIKITSPETIVICIEEPYWRDLVY